MANSAGDAHEFPIWGAHFRVTFPILDNTGALVTGAAGLDSEFSNDAGTFADCTNEATEIATSSGIYYLDLIGTEMDAKQVVVQVKTSTTNAKTTVLVFYPERLTKLVSAATAQGGGGSTITLAAGTSKVDNDMVGLYVFCANNSPAGVQYQVRKIISNVASTQVATVDSAWGTNPDNTTTYDLLARSTANIASYAGTLPPTLATAGVQDVNAKAWGNTTITASSIPVATAAGAAGGLFIAGSNAATTISGLTTGALACTTITASGAVAFQSTFAVTTSTSLAALSATTVTFSGAVAFQSTFTVTTSTSLAALSATTVTFSGAVAFQSTFIVTGAVTFSSTFATTGTTTFNAFTVTNATTLSGAVSLGSTLSVTGATTLAALSMTTLTASGAVAFQSTFTVTTSTSLAALSATTVTFSGAVAFQSTFTVTTSTSLAALSCTTLTASGAVAFQSTFAVTTSTSLAALSATTITASGTTSLAAVTTSGTVTFNAFTVSNALTVSGATTFTGAITASNASNNIVGITVSALGNNVITAASIAADAITAAKVADGTIDAATFAAGAINAAAIAADAITAAKIADGAIDAATFAAGAINAAAIASDAITAAKIADGAIDAATFAASAITATVIATDAIGSAQLATSALTEIVNGVWDVAIAGHLTAGSTGAALNAAGAAGDPWGTALPGAYGAGTAGFILGTNLNAAVASVPGAVWDVAIAGHLTAGSTGATLAAAGSAGDPWITPLPGSYVAGTAGYIVGNLTSNLGPGSISFTITINDDMSNPLDGAEVWVSTDQAGANVIAGTLHTNASGQATFLLDAGSYWLWVAHSGYNRDNPTSFTVS